MDELLVRVVQVTTLFRVRMAPEILGGRGRETIPPFRYTFRSTGIGTVKESNVTTVSFRYTFPVWELTQSHNMTL